MSCLWCGERISAGDRVLKLRVGELRYLKRGPSFKASTFPDSTAVKWAHQACYPDADPDGLRFDWCCLCDQQFFPEESAVFVEEGKLLFRPDGPTFEGRSGGLAHYLCLDDWGIRLWEIERDY